MSALLAPRLLLLLGECLAASALLPLLALAAARCFSRRAAMRHLVWAASFAGLLALPLAAALVPSRVVIAQAAAPAVAMTNIAPAATMTDEAPSAMPESIAVVTPRPAPAPRAFDPALLLEAGLALWLAGFLFMLLYRALALLGLRRLRRASVAHDMPEIEGPCELRLATTPHGPMTWGMLRPVILLPREALAWPRERLTLVLRHELAHVRRHDTLTQTIAQLACALYWPNPLVWLAARHLRREAEIAADDAVIAAGIRPSAYAEALLALASEFRRPASALAMAAPSALAARVTSVLSPNPSRTGVTRMDAFRIASLSVCALALMAVARPDLAAAQSAAPVAPVAPAAPAAAPAPVAAPVAPKVEKNVEINVGKDVALDATANSAAFAARAAVIKAGADTAAAKARARAEAEKDPAKKAQYSKEAAQVAAQSERLKANADRLAERAKANADHLQAQMDKIKPQVLVEAKEAVTRAKAELDRIKPQMAQAAKAAARNLTIAANTPPSSHEATAETESTWTTNGTTTITSSKNGQVRIDADSIHFNGATPQTARSQTLGMASPSDAERPIQRTDRKIDHVDVAIQLDPAATEAMRNVTREMRDVINTAMSEAAKEAVDKVNAAIAKAKLDTH